jgi:hypothetical protein
MDKRNAGRLTGMKRDSKQKDRGLPLWSGLAAGAFFLHGISAVMAATTTNAVKAAPQQQLRDIKSPIVITSPWTWVQRSGVILAVAALLALTWWWWRRRQPVTAAKAGVSPAARARQRLAAALGLIDQPERFATEVSEIARTYLEERFGLHAPERTTEEFLEELTTSVALDSRHKVLLSGFLTNCDLVKFARAEPGLTELEALHAAAVRLVDETAPVATPAAPPQLSGSAVLK